MVDPSNLIYVKVIEETQDDSRSDMSISELSESSFKPITHQYTQTDFIEKKDRKTQTKTKTKKSKNTEQTDWEVSEITSKRFNETTGKNELLVHWTPSWLEESEVLRGAPLLLKEYLDKEKLRNYRIPKVKKPKLSDENEYGI